MFVGVGINDENYTLLDCHFDENLGDLLLKMQDVGQSEIAGKCTIELSFPDEDVNWAIRGDAVNDDNRDNFYVFKIFHIDDDCPYILVRWHAYDGVDFEVEEFNSIRLARGAMWSHYYEDRYVYSDGNNNDDSDLGSYSSVFDTGEEFLMQQIVEVGTYAEIEEEKGEHKMNKNVAIGFGLGVLELSSGVIGYDVGSKICKSLGIGGFKRVIFSIAAGRFIEEEFVAAYRVFIPDERYDDICKDVRSWLEEKIGLKKGPHIVKD